MDPINWLVRTIDPVLVAPYRWLADPGLAWWWGTLLLALWCTLLGELTLALAYRLNRRYVLQAAQEMTRSHNQSIEALKAGDKQAWRGFNRMANEAFGKSFFLQIAMGSSSLWPAFLAAAWLQARFAGLEIPLPVLAWTVGWLPGFLVCYLVVRLLFSRLKRRLPFFRQTLALARSLAPQERLDLLGIHAGEGGQGGPGYGSEEGIK